MTKIDIFPNEDQPMVEPIRTNAYLVAWLDPDTHEWHVKGNGDVKAIAPLILSAISKQIKWPFPKP